MSIIVFKTKKQEHWNNIVQSYRNSSLSQVEFSEKHKISLHTLRYWCAKFPEDSSTASPTPSFSRVIVEGARPLSRAAMRLPSGIELELSDHLALLLVEKLLGGKQS